MLAELEKTLLLLLKDTEAEAQLRKGLKLLEAVKPTAWKTFATQSLLGGSLLGQKKYADAQPLLLAGYEGMKARAQTLPANEKPRLTEALQRLVQLYDEWGKPDEAAKWRKELEAR